jgi:hypothetical protein
MNLYLNEIRKYDVNKHPYYLKTISDLKSGHLPSDSCKQRGFFHPKVTICDLKVNHSYTLILPYSHTLILSKVPPLMKDIFLCVSRNGCFIATRQGEDGQFVIHNFGKMTE